jgi:tripartite-type tricarboxylate transporter receptor subunit TctC
MSGKAEPTERPAALSQVNFVVGAGPGGGYDLYSRIFTEHLSRHLPGKPNIVLSYMPGASGTKAAEYLYSLAAQDGSVIGLPLPSALLSEAVEPSGRFRMREFGWIGTIATQTDVLGVTEGADIASIEEARSKVALIGATAGRLSGPYLQPALTNALLGTKFRIIGGYKSMNEVVLAQERSEVQGRAGSWMSWKRASAESIKAGKIKFLLQYGPSEDELPNVPNLADFVKSEKDVRIVELLSLIQVMGRTIAAPPGVPEKVLAMYRTAFDRTIADPAFIASMEARDQEVRPRTGAQIESILNRVAPTLTTTGSELKAILAGN